MAGKSKKKVLDSSQSPADAGTDSGKIDYRVVLAPLGYHLYPRGVFSLSADEVNAAEKHGCVLVPLGGVIRGVLDSSQSAADAGTDSGSDGVISADNGSRLRSN